MKKNALCIGINNYPGTNSDLSGCINDVMDWTNVLEKRGFTVTQLLDKQATKAGIIGGIEKLIRDAKGGDRLVLQFSGHGSYIADDDIDEEPDGRDELICPCDVGPNAFIRDDDLHDLFSQMQPDVRLVFLSDSCHSGTVSKFAPPIGVAEKMPKARFLPPSMFLREEQWMAAARVSRSRSRGPLPQQGLLISGCQDVQTSADAWFDGRANGAFTYYAIKALADLPANATYTQWFKAIRKFLPSAVYVQQPNLFGTTNQKKWSVFA